MNIQTAGRFSSYFVLNESLLSEFMCIIACPFAKIKIFRQFFYVNIVNNFFLI